MLDFSEGWLNSELYGSSKFNRSSPQCNLVFAQLTELDLAFEFNAVSELYTDLAQMNGFLSGPNWG